MKETGNGLSSLSQEGLIENQFTGSDTIEAFGAWAGTLRIVLLMKCVLHWASLQPVARGLGSSTPALPPCYSLLPPFSLLFALALLTGAINGKD